MEGEGERNTQSEPGEQRNRDGESEIDREKEIEEE